MKKMLSFIIIFVLIATGLGFTSPELQNKEMDFSEEDAWEKTSNTLLDKDFNNEELFYQTAVGKSTILRTLRKGLTIFCKNTGKRITLNNTPGYVTDYGTWSHTDMIQ